MTSFELGLQVDAVMIALEIVGGTAIIVGVLFGALVWRVNWLAMKQDAPELPLADWSHSRHGINQGARLSTSVMAAE
ncbi:hypothetical protein SAMN05444161_8409 [Rhizobiales bacterium GAS191]|nr:hypothetical protein SAMN05444161_8409 [Rhizobiales bacterium GAS191]